MPGIGSFKYLYERLGDQRFQKLCGALVVDRWDDVEVFPVGQKDGGRDIVAGKKNTVLQVKFTKDRIRQPLSWLKSAIKREDENIRRLKARGCTRYVIMTNVEGSAARGSGDRDQMDKALEQFGRTYQLDMSVMWCTDIDAWVDLAGPDLKLAYVDMLAGSDALVALLQSTSLQANEQRERALLTDYVSTHWERDKKVKFTQVDLKSNLLSDLFVDVTAVRTRSPRKVRLAETELGGLAQHLLGTPLPFTLVEGVPGQGKSTVAQYVSQVHRADFIGRDRLAETGETCPTHKSETLRLPVRIDLADYARWMSGHDPFAADSTKTASGTPRVKADVETFLVAHFDACTAGYNVGIGDIRGIIGRYATSVVFDGLDEVASVQVRARVVKEIDEFTTRHAQARPGNMHILVTTRPNASDLAEPASDLYERVVLQPLDESLRKRYLRQWATAQELDKPHTRTVERIFGERTAAPHVAQLANNPMQLTILLHLIHTKGESLPVARTDLYEQYMTLFLDREAAKSEIVLNNRPDIEEATAYLGWYLQGLAELDSASTKLPETRIVSTMTRYLAGVGRANSPVKDVFDAMNDRVWVLTSKDTGTFEFDVQPIREFFAAKFLHEFASGQDGSSFDAATALKEMLSRAYWSNTARFLGGLFQANRVPDIADTVIERFREGGGARQVQTTTWTLLSDGVFSRRTLAQSRVAELFADDLSLRLLVMGDSTHVADLSPDYGGSHLGNLLLDRVESDPTSPMTLDRAFVASKVGELGAFTKRWTAAMSEAVGTHNEAAWLTAAVPSRAGRALPAGDIARLKLGTAEAARMAISSGVTPPSDSPQAATLLRWVLDGHCSAVRPDGDSEAADVLRVVPPSQFVALAEESGTIASSHARTKALQRLRASHRGFEKVQNCMRNRRGEVGTTSRWINTARELANVYGGPCWLATEIAVIGAALPQDRFRTGGNLTPGAPCFGPDMDYGQWVPGMRVNRAKADWWREHRALCTEDHSLAAWIIGLLVVADSNVIRELVADLDKAAYGLSEHPRSALVATSSRIGLSRVVRSLDLTNFDEDIAPITRLLLAHRASDPVALIGGDPYTLREIAVYEDGAWPGVRAASTRALDHPTQENLDLVEAFGACGDVKIPQSHHLAEDAARYVLNHPTRFPGAWLTLAEQSLSRDEQVAPLKTHAEAAWGIA